MTSQEAGAVGQVGRNVMACTKEGEAQGKHHAPHRERTGRQAQAMRFGIAIPLVRLCFPGLMAFVAEDMRKGCSKRVSNSFRLVLVASPCGSVD